MNDPRSQAMAMLDPELAGVQLHGPEDFEGMRKSGQLAAEVLDFITPHVVPRREHRRIRPTLPRLHCRT